MSGHLVSVTRQGLLALARHVLQDSPTVRIGASAIGERSARALHLAELAQMGGAVPGRVMEFVAGRVAAREALGLDAAIPMAEDRAPVWPQGWIGSITHGAGWAVAAAQPEPAMLGLDLEPDQDLPGDVWDIVLSKEESAWCRAQPSPGRAARIIFSAKECAYKAQYPRSKQIFGFERFEIRMTDAGFTARFTADTGPFAKGSILTGHFARSEGIILTGIAL